MKNYEKYYKKEIIARNEEARNYDDWYIKTKGILYDWVEKKSILDALNLKKTDVVLDAGCGTGRFTTLIAKKCKGVYAFDISKESIRVLTEKLKKEKIKNVKTFVSNILDPLPIKEKIDKIISIQVIQHIRTRDERRKALINLYNQLKDRGKIVITVYNWNFYSKMIGNLKEGEFENGIYFYRFSPNEAKILLEQCGFKKVTIKSCVNFKKYHWLNHWKLYKLFYPLAMIDVLFSKIQPFLGDFLICRGIK